MIRRIVGAGALALVLGLGAIALWAPIPSFVQVLAAAVVIVVLAGAATTALAGWSEPADEREFDAIVERSERLAADGEDGWEEPDDDDEELTPLFDPAREEDFQAVVRRAIDDLPLEFHHALEHVAVVVSDGGRRRRAYGLYEGDTVARDHFHDRILVFRDTLVRDFGHDPDLLRKQITRTLRHELAHHLGWDERGVRGLGL